MIMDFAERYQKQYYNVFLAMVILCWSPFKMLVNFTPFIVVILLTLLVRERRFAILNTSLVTSLLIYSLIIVSLFFLYLLIFFDEFILSNAIFSLITYSITVVIFVVPSKGLGSDRLLAKMSKTLLVFYIIESLYGIMQAMYGFLQEGSFDLSNGDYVEGTIHPALASDLSLSNPLYTVNMISMAIILYFAARYLNRPKWIWVVLCFGIAIILASVVHLILFLILALLAWKFSQIRLQRITFSPTRIVVAILVITATSFTIAKTLGGNIQTAAGYYEMFQKIKPAKIVVVENFFNRVRAEKPVAFIMGFGPGQYASKADLMLNSSYIGKRLFSNSTPRKEAEKYFLSVYESQPKEGQSAIVKPFFSLFSILTEFGLIGLVVFFGMVFSFLYRIRSLRVNSILSGLVICLSVFILLLGLLEYYWETPHAILLPLLFLKPVFAILKNDS